MSAKSGNANRPSVGDFRFKLERPVTVAVTGEASTGKSTLINALLGRDVLPTGVVPTTGHLTELRFGWRERVILHRCGGALEEVGLPWLKEFGDRGRPSVDQLVKRAEVALRHPWLQTFAFLDTPAAGADEGEDRLLMGELQTADIVIWCTQAQAAWKGSEAERFDRFQSTAPAKPQMVVVTRQDCLNEEGEDERVGARLKRGLGEIRILFVGLKGEGRFKEQSLPNASGSNVENGLPESRVDKIVQAIRRTPIETFSARLTRTIVEARKKQFDAAFEEARREVDVCPRSSMA